MFADKATAEARAEIAAAEWRKAKAVWRRFAVVLLAILLGLALFVTWLAGDLHGRRDCTCSNSARPAPRSTP